MMWYTSFQVPPNVELAAVQCVGLCIGHGGKWLLVAVFIFNRLLILQALAVLTPMSNTNNDENLRGNGYRRRECQLCLHQ